jgi:thioredoxin reductase
MTQEERDTAISEAFYNCTIHSIVTNTHSREGLHRLEWIKDKLNKVPVVYDLQRQNFNHRYILDVLEDAIKQNKKFNEDFNNKFNKP